MDGGEPSASKQVRRTLLPVVTDEEILDTGLEGGTVVEGISVGMTRLFCVLHYFIKTIIFAKLLFLLLRFTKHCEFDGLLVISTIARNLTVIVSGVCSCHLDKSQSSIIQSDTAFIFSYRKKKDA